MPVDLQRPRSWYCIPGRTCSCSTATTTSAYVFGDHHPWFWVAGLKVRFRGVVFRGRIGIYFYSSDGFTLVVFASYSRVSILDWILVELGNGRQAPTPASSGSSCNRHRRSFCPSPCRSRARLPPGNSGKFQYYESSQSHFVLVWSFLLVFEKSLSPGLTYSWHSIL